MNRRTALKLFIAGFFAPKVEALVPPLSTDGCFGYAQPGAVFVSSKEMLRTFLLPATRKALLPAEQPVAPDNRIICWTCDGSGRELSGYPEWDYACLTCHGKGKV